MSLLQKEVWWLSLSSDVVANRKTNATKEGEKGLKVITLPCSMSDLPELPALVQEQSELFNPSVLRKTQKGAFGADKIQLRCLSKVRKCTYGLCLTMLPTDMPHKRLSLNIWPLHQSSG